MVTKTTTGRSTRVLRTVTTDMYPGLPSVNTFSGTTTPNVKTSERVKTWERTANYRALVKAGVKLPDQPFSYSEFILFPGVISWATQTPLGGGGTRIQRSTDSAFYYAHTNAGPSIPGIQNAAISKLHSKVRGNEWNAPVFLAEAGKSAQMIYQRATDLTNLIRSLRRGDLSTFFALLRGETSRGHRRKLEKQYKNGRAEPSKAAANVWLETAYGWTPLMADVQNAVALAMDLSESENNRLGRTKAGAFAGRTFVTTAGTTTWPQREYRKVVERYRYTWLWEPRSGFIPAKFGILNPLTVAWELVPFSFVADWFLPIGNWIASMDMGFRTTHRGGTLGYRKETDTTIVMYNGGQSSSVVSYEGLARSSHVEVRRDRLTSTPQLSLEDVVLRYDLKTKQMFSAVSLLRQNLSFFRR